jgi:MerR family transcriptional regulator/heat shock protein HspR
VKASDGVFVISVAARLVGMHANTLRKYEKEELLAPARTTGNLRLYSAEDISRLQQIRMLSEQHGINVAGIRLALRVGEELRRLREEVAEWSGIEDDVRRKLIRRLDRVLEELELPVNNFNKE